MLSVDLVAKAVTGDCRNYIPCFTMPILLYSVSWTYLPGTLRTSHQQSPGIRGHKIRLLKCRFSPLAQPRNSWRTGPIRIRNKDSCGKNSDSLGMVTHACNLTLRSLRQEDCWECKLFWATCWIPGPPGQHRNNLSLKKKIKSFYSKVYWISKHQKRKLTMVIKM